MLSARYLFMPAWTSGALVLITFRMPIRFTHLQSKAAVVVIAEGSIYREEGLTSVMSV